MLLLLQVFETNMALIIPDNGAGGKLRCSVKLPQHMKMFPILGK